MAQKNKSSKHATKVVSFRVSLDYFEKLEEHARGQVDDAGLPLNVHTVARRFVVGALKDFSGEQRERNKKS